MQFPRYRALVLGILVLAVSLVGLAGCGSAGAAPTATTGPTPTATPEPQVLAYLTILHKDYELGLYPDMIALLNCGLPFGNGPYGQASAADKPAIMKANCLDPSTTTQRDAQTLFDQLSAATAPSRWQTQDAGFKQAAKALAKYMDTVLAAINAGSVSQFEATFPNFFPTWGMFCDPIHQIDPTVPLDYTLNVPKGGVCG